MTKLLRSKDRKVTNAVSPNGKTATLANTFGLPAGKAYSCPGATSVCERICYAGKLERIFKGTRENLLHNWNLLSNADAPYMYVLLSEMIAEFVADCQRKNAPMLFRIHWDGDFFSMEYTEAWAAVISDYPEVTFWAYTRVRESAEFLNAQALPNLSLYFSTDSENVHDGKALSAEGIKLAYLAQTFEMGKQDLLDLIGNAGTRCPENNKALPLISTKGSACVTCGLCVHNRNDVLFSASKK